MSPANSIVCGLRTSVDTSHHRVGSRKPVRNHGQFQFQSSSMSNLPTCHRDPKDLNTPRGFLLPNVWRASDAESTSRRLCFTFAIGGIARNPSPSYCAGCTIGSDFTMENYAPLKRTDIRSGRRKCYENFASGTNAALPGDTLCSFNASLKLSQ